ncbi:ABC transporter permease [Streptomyces sp. NPDC090493]|uniref:ABC transporter permease n=1 Tax=Streptomyces sp. NPDC090493 TaxID=3365964 RepID=UPI003815CF4D
MIRLILRRLLLALPLVFAVSVLTFVLVALTPGDPAVSILGSNATKEQYAELDHRLGFDQPVWTQYWHWLTKALHGDLGTSLLSSQSVTSQLNGRIGATLSLVVGATLLTALLGIALGLMGAVRGGAVGRGTDLVAMLGFAIPNFWLGLVLADLFALRAGWLPATGYVPFGQSPSRWLESLILPVAALAAAGVTGVAKQTRDSLRDALSQGYVDALRADGVPERTIVLRHALKNAAIPVVTMLGTFFVSLLGGTILVENVFAIQGLGSLAVGSTTEHDLPVIQGVALYFCLGVVVVNLLVDLVYGWLNPKARIS